MSIFELILVSISLSSDAFAVAFSKGMSIKDIKIYHALIVGVYFGVFQGLMPFLGYLMSNNLSIYLVRFSHLIGFIILLLIGLNMLRENLESQSHLIDFKTMIPLSIGTSIDALAVGLTLPFMVDSIVFPCFLIGLITFILSSLGVSFANKIKDKINTSPQRIGGIILILLAIKMFFEFLNLI